MVSTPLGESKQRPFRILSLDGGGIMGAFAAAFLAQVEAITKKRVVDYFDLIAGTSTGGIIAAGLAAEVPASQILQLYLERGKSIFTRRRPFNPMLTCVFDIFLSKLDLDCRMIGWPKYKSQNLTNALTDVFGDLKIGDIRRTRLVMPAVDITNGQTVVFKTPHLPNMVRDRHYKISETVRATAAAPTYFEPSKINEKGAYVDGGVWANNPAMVGVTEAVSIIEKCKRPGLDPEFTLADVHCLSIGTGTYKYFEKPPTWAGIGWWMAKSRIFTVMMASQSQGVDFQMQHILGARYKRINFDVPNTSWTLDNVKVLPDLAHFGEQKANAECATVDAQFLQNKVLSYVPFPE